MTRFLSTILLMGFYLQISAQSQLSRIQENFKTVLTDSTNRIEIKKESNFWRTFYKVKDIENEQNNIRGNVKFGFVGNSTESKEIYILNSGIDIKQGIYPGEFEFSTLLNTQFNSGNLVENLSNLRITYDRFFSTAKNKMLYEGFAFVNRRSDKYLSVNQRYEIGCGITIAHWSSNLSDIFQQKIDDLNSNKISIIPSKKEIVFYSDKEKETIKVKEITEKDSIDYELALSNIKYTIIKRYTPFRAGVLIGIFYEIENIVLEDIEIPDNEKKDQYEFDTSSKYRWEIRPTLDFFLNDKLKLKIRPYFKMPMIWEWKALVNNTQEIDYRIDFPTTFELNLDDNFAFLVEYRYCYDNAPNSTPNPYKSNEFLTANDTHHYVSFQVVYNF